MPAQGSTGQRLWWLVLGLLAVNGLVLLLLVLPARSQRAQEDNLLLDLQRRIRALQREGQSGEGVLTAFREVEEFTQGYPPLTDMVPLIGRLTKLAQSLALEVPTVDYRPSTVKEAGLTKVAVSMGIQGSYGKIRRFVYDLETMRRQLVIETLSLDDPKGTSDLQVKLQLALYFR
ncbi:MAG TPA: type 4a pilus biogenesis protein PilO [Candidatus Methylomirabilis sp.]|nr:type 4a pilus biogenesis protein PilO [Candidatus Methylomirabilis sp.]